MNALQSSKATATEVKEQLEVSMKNEERIDIAREVQDTYMLRHTCVLSLSFRAIVPVPREHLFSSS